MVVFRRVNVMNDKKPATTGEELANKIEGILFYKASPMKFSQLQKLFGVKEEVLMGTLAVLSERLENTGIRLVQSDTDVQLSTAPELDAMIEEIRKDELKRDIGKAGAETLAIILYKGPISRVEIDRIRGVNSAFILRNLMVRGLIERNTEGKSHTFTVTTHLLNHLGIQHKTHLPNYTSILDQLEKFEVEAAREAEQT